MMMFVLTMIMLLVAITLLVPISVLFIECGAALLLPSRATNRQLSGRRPSIAVLIPARDEAQVICATLRSLLPQMTSRDRVIVIADNCTDNTAAVVRKMEQVSVIERQDPHRKGKGYVLDFGLDSLRATPPNVVIMIDADCYVHPNTINALSHMVETLGRPVQANYLSQPPPYPKTNDLISALAVKVKNMVRPEGLARLGLPCLLTGSGMAFPWHVICNAQLATGDITEDMRLSVDLALKGYPPAFCSNALVTSSLPAGAQAAKKQRTRWEHGHLKSLLTQGIRLFREVIKQRRFYLLALLLELGVPPLALLATIWGLGIVAASLMAAVGGSRVPLVLMCFGGMLLLTAIVGVWAKYGRVLLSLKTLMAVPAYILWKIPIYLAFLGRSQSEWTPTERNVPVETDEMERA